MKKIYVLSLCVALALLSPCIVESEEVKSTSNTQEVEKNMYAWSRTFAEVMNLVAQKHFNPDKIEQAMVKAIDAFLTTLDPHSSFLDAKAFKAMMESTSGEFFGIGIVIDNTRKPKDKYLIIVDTIPDGPADKAGIKPLDKIIEVAAKPLEGMTTEEATAMLKGERNTKVHVKILREGQPDLLSFDITRDVVKEQNSMSFYIKDQNIYYLSLNMFTESSAKQVEQLLKKASDNEYRGLILDLRNNSGGLLLSAVDIAGLFLERNSLVVVTKDKTNTATERYNTRRDPIAKRTLPIFILINNYTASAAEILAGFLKTHSDLLAQQKNSAAPLVFLVGTKTFGKGSVQEVIPVSGNCAVKITTSLYYLPNDITIQGTGIEPDFKIERTIPATEQMQWFTKYYGRESALENYIKPTGDTPATTPATDAAKNQDQSASRRWIERAKLMLQTDNQLRETIALINMFDSARKVCPDLVKDRQSAIRFLGSQFIADDALQIEEVKP